MKNDMGGVTIFHFPVATFVGTSNTRCMASNVPTLRTRLEDTCAGLLSVELERSAEAETAPYETQRSEAKGAARAYRVARQAIEQALRETLPPAADPYLERFEAQARAGYETGARAEVMGRLYLGIDISGISAAEAAK